MDSHLTQAGGHSVVGVERLAAHTATSLEAGGRWLNSASAVAVASLGVMLGAIVLLFDRASWPAENVTFSRSGSFLLWGFLIIAQTALWPVAIGVVVPGIQKLWRYLPGNRREVLESLLLIGIATWAGLLVATYVPAFPSYLPHHRLKLLILGGGGWLTGSTAALGIWLAHGAFKELCDVRRQITADDFARFLELRRQLQQFLLVTGTVVGLAILSVGAQRNMISAWVTAYGGPGGFPIEYVLIYGFYFSGLLALVYFPTHLTMLRAGERIRDTFCPLPELSSTIDWTPAWTRRSTLESVLALNVAGGTTFKAAVGILTPLIGSLTGLLLNAHS